MRNLLIVAYAFPPQNTVGAARPHRFYKFLPEFGYMPHVITASADAGLNLPRVLRVPEPMMGSYPGRVIEGFLQRQTEEGMIWQFPAVKAARRLMKSVAFDAILSTSPPVSTHLTARALAGKSGIPWVADFRDALVFNHLGVKRRLARILNRRWERQIFKGASAVIGVADPMLEAWKTVYPNLSAKMHLIYNGFDPEHRLAPLPVPKRSHKLMAHVGGLYGQRTPAPILAAFQRLLNAGRITPDDVQLEMIGELEPRVFEKCRAQIADLEARGFLKCVPRNVPRAEAVRAMAEADYLLVLDNNDANRSYGIPVKLIEYLQIGRPVLAFTPENSPPETMLRESGVPHCILRTTDSEARIDDSIAEFLKLPSDPVSASDWFRVNFDGRRQAATLAGIFDRLIGSQGKTAAD